MLLNILSARALYGKKGSGTWGAQELIFTQNVHRTSAGAETPPDGHFTLLIFLSEITLDTSIDILCCGWKLTKCSEEEFEIEKPRFQPISILVTQCFIECYEEAFIRWNPLYRIENDCCRLIRSKIIGRRIIMSPLSSSCFRFDTMNKTNKWLNRFFEGDKRLIGVAFDRHQLPGGIEFDIQETLLISFCVVVCIDVFRSRFSVSCAGMKCVDFRCPLSTFNNQQNSIKKKCILVCYTLAAKRGLKSGDFLYFWIFNVNRCIRVSLSCYNSVLLTHLRHEQSSIETKSRGMEGFSLSPEQRMFIINSITTDTFLGRSSINVHFSWLISNKRLTIVFSNDCDPIIRANDTKCRVLLLCCLDCRMMYSRPCTLQNCSLEWRTMPWHISLISFH